MNHKIHEYIPLVIGLIIAAGLAGYFAGRQQEAPLPSVTLTVPFVERIEPAQAVVGAEISVYGSGFTPTENSLQFGEGLSYIHNLSSLDGQKITFTLPDSFDTCTPDGSVCSEFSGRAMPGQTYAVAVINANRTSNRVHFTIALAVPLSTSTLRSVPYNPDGTCPPGYVSYGIPLMCITTEYMEYCKTHPCPICLAGDMLIDTPSGLVRVKEMPVGMPIWTVNAEGYRVPVIVLKTSKTSAPPTHEVVHLALDDGRELFVSPGHPTIDGRTVGNIAVGERYGGATVVSVARIPYSEGATYDVLPSGETGFYWANGILLGSTLK